MRAHLYSEAVDRGITKGVTKECPKGVSRSRNKVKPYVQ